MDKTKIEKLSLIVATLITYISQKVISAWTNELKVARNIEIDNVAFTSLIFESVIFGHYYVGQKFKGFMNKDDAMVFLGALDEKVIFLLSVLLESEEENMDAHEEKISRVYKELSHAQHEALASFRGSILELFKEGGLRRIFNDNNYKIKFINHSIVSSVKLKIAKMLSGGNPEFQYANDIFLDNKVLFVVADNLYKEFSGLDYNQLIHEAETV